MHTQTTIHFIISQSSRESTSKHEEHILVSPWCFNFLISSLVCLSTPGSLCPTERKPIRFSHRPSNNVNKPVVEYLPSSRVFRWRRLFFQVVWCWIWHLRGKKKRGRLSNFLKWAKPRHFLVGWALMFARPILVPTWICGFWTKENSGRSSCDSKWLTQIAQTQIIGCISLHF